MTRFSPSVRGRYGIAGDVNGNADQYITVNANAGDWVYWMAETSDYRQVLRSDGPRWDRAGMGGWMNQVWWNGPSGYGNVYISASQCFTTGTYNVYSYFSGGNNGANYENIRAIVFYDTEGPAGNANVITKATGSPDGTVYQNKNKSVIVYNAVDWNAVAYANRSYWGANYEDNYFAGGAAGYLTGFFSDGGGPGNRAIGSNQPTNWRLAMGWAEVGGIDRDVTAPSVPTGVTATAIAVNQNRVNWSASSDDYGTTGYQVKRNGVVVANPGNVLTWTDTAAVPGAVYSYQVNAVDAAGNRSVDSNGYNVTSLRTNFMMGSTRPNMLYVAGSQASKIYLGTNQLWP